MALVAAATAARAAVDPWLGPQTPFAFHLVAVLIAAWSAGFGPSVLATLASAVAVDYLFMEPRYSLAPLAIQNSAGIALFVTLGIATAWLTSRWRAAERSAAATQEELRRRAEQVEFQATLLDHAYDAVFVRDADQRITLWNRGAQETYGWTAAEAIGQNAHRLLGTAPELERDFTGKLAASGTWSGQIEHRRKDGGAVVSDSRQVVVGSGDVLEVNRDITERQRAVTALEANERQLTALMNAATESIWLVDRERVLAVNTTAAGRIVKTVDEARGARWRDLLPPDVAATRAKMVDQVFASREPVRFEDDRDGMRFSHTFYPVFDPANDVTAVAVFSTDVTERKRAEDEVRALSQRLSYHVEHSPLAVIEFGPDMRLTRWAGAAERLFGWTAEEVLGKRMQDFRWVYEEDDAEVNAVSDALQSGRDPRRVSSNRNYRKDGTVVRCEWYNSSLVDANGNLESILSLVLDVTERERLEAELRHRAQQLASANRLKDEFLATLSHELRTPLNAILGWSQILAAGAAPPDRVQRGVEAITRNARLQARLVEDILDVSRIMTGNVRLDIQPVDVHAAIEQAIDAFRPAADAKHLAVSSAIEPNLRFVADRVRVQQVIWNLLSNAVKFTPAGGSVSVEAHEDDGHVEIKVRDNGIGIRSEFLPHVFDRFTQADSSPTRAHGGLGLGLAIVRHIVELHGGTVGVTSAGEGHGSVFTVRLPIVAPQSAVAAG